MINYQFVAVVLILLVAVIYASWRIYRALRSDSDPCSGCELKKNCQKFGQSKKK